MLGGGLIITSVSAGENSTAYPFKPLRVVASSAGGSADSVARLLGLKIAANLGQPLVIDNRGGSGGIVPRTSDCAVSQSTSQLRWHGA